jgi:hypothetical protein
MEKGILIKRGETDFRLYVNEIPFATTDNSPYKKLSLRNCISIENGYDLEELAEQASKGIIENHIWALSMVYFKAGFERALGILKDKKFSEADMHDAVMLGTCFENPGIEGISNYNEAKDLAIKRATKTEWEVKFNPKQKDEEGCLKLIKC